MESVKYFYKFEKDLFMQTSFWVSKSYFETSHFHNCIEIGCCIGGEGEFLFSGKSYTVEQGAIFIVNQLEPHVCCSKEDNPANFIFLFCAPSLIEELDPMLLLPFIYKPEKFKNKIPAGSETSDKIYRLINEIHDEIIKQDISYINLVKSLMIQICVLINRYYRNEASGNIKEENLFYNFEKIRQVTEYIQNNLDKDITLAFVSKMFFMSESRLRHLFKDTIGVGFKDYVNHYRIESAKRLITDTNESINCVCEKCGFQSISSFYRVFKDITGYSPAKYRENAYVSELS